MSYPKGSVVIEREGPMTLARNATNDRLDVWAEDGTCVTSWCRTGAEVHAYWAGYRDGRWDAELSASEVLP